STGNYNRQIDIYASGIILYEMLTGRVPFEGESAGEILMKHLTAPPDLSKLPPAFVGVVGKSLAKNPAHRFSSLAEMAKAVEDVGKGVQPEGVRGERGAAAPNVPRAAVSKRPAEEQIPCVLPVRSVRGQVGELCGSMAMAVVLAGVAAIMFSAL